MQGENRIFEAADSADLLINSIKNKNWDLVAFYVHQSSLPDEKDNYALHYVCRDNMTPMNIVQMMYYAFPEAVYLEDSDGDTPLINAVQFCFFKAADFLSYQNPETLLIANYENGMIPLQYALDFSEPNSNMIDLLLVANPNAVNILHNKGLTIFESFFNERNCSLRAFLNREFDVNFSSPALNHRITADEAIWSAREVYLKSRLLLQAAYMTTFNRDTVNDSWLLLHSSLKLDDCPWSFCNFYLRLHPEQVMITDSNGDLPIHIITAASNKSSDIRSINCDCCGSIENIHYFETENTVSRAVCSTCHRTDFPNHLVENIMQPLLKVPTLIQDLLSVNTHMVCIPDSNGNYPLHISIFNQQVFNATKQIFDASPWVGREANNVDGLFPFKSAAVGSWRNGLDQVNTILYLLQQDPVLVTY